MNIRKHIIVESFIESFKAIKRKKLYILLPVIVDLFFIFILGFSTEFFVSNIKEKAVALLQTGKSILYSGGLIKGLLTNNETLAIILSVVALMITTYLQYCIFQGLTWRFARKFIEKVKFFEYTKKFFLVNIFWFLLFFLVQGLDYIRRLLSYLRGEAFGGSVFSNLLLFFIFLIVYFAFISYALITRYKTVKAVKRSFSLGIKRTKDFLLMYLIISLMFLIINVLLVLVSKVHFILMVIIGFLTVSPAFTWARVFIELVVGKVDRK